MIASLWSLQLFNSSDQIRSSASTKMELSLVVLARVSLEVEQKLFGFHLPCCSLLFNQIVIIVQQLAKMFERLSITTNLPMCSYTLWVLDPKTFRAVSFHHMIILAYYHWIRLMYSPNCLLRCRLYYRKTCLGYRGRCFRHLGCLRGRQNPWFGLNPLFFVVFCDLMDLRLPSCCFSFVRFHCWIERCYWLQTAHVAQ